jgi:DNA-binding response OmpR family regulator
VDSNVEVALTTRLFDTLLCFLQNPDRLLDREELSRAVWGSRTVSEGNLQKAVSSLRKVLQDRAPRVVYPERNRNTVTKRIEQILFTTAVFVSNPEAFNLID